MIPVTCMVKHNPPHSYGDCLGACVASILELPAAAVPHFYHDGCDGETGNKRLINWLATRGNAPVFSCFDGDTPLEELMTTAEIVTNGAHYLLFGTTENDGEHVVVCRGNKVVHNPSWGGTRIVKPTSNGIWILMVIALI